MRSEEEGVGISSTSNISYADTVESAIITTKLLFERVEFKP